MKWFWKKVLRPAVGFLFTKDKDGVRPSKSAAYVMGGIGTVLANPDMPELVQALIVAGTSLVAAIRQLAGAFKKKPK